MFVLEITIIHKPCCTEPIDRHGNNSQIKVRSPNVCSRTVVLSKFDTNLWIKPGLHEQIKHALFAQIFDPYEVTLLECAQIKRVLFAHVNEA